jgi:NAD(P)-dependent dehydrogenase (short-subunit alcohol dehydrogenase family)
MNKKLSRCLVCKQPYSQPHWHYRQLCQNCGEFDLEKQQQTADLTGKMAIVTGARTNIGYGVCLRLLRSGATVIGTTRFPHHAAQKYASEADFSNWHDRLQLYPLDLRNLAIVEAFTKSIALSYPDLDIIVNNAAQTIRRPPAYYRHLIELESQSIDTLSPQIQSLIATPSANLDPTLNYLTSTTNLIPTQTYENVAALSQLKLIPEDDADLSLFPVGEYDRDGNQIDLRSSNSWLLSDDEVSIVELLEVHAVNAIAPFIINSRLKAMMKRRDNLDKYIINVSSQEGRFDGVDKPWRHPHTNMAKAALNQMTRTCAKEYAKHRIFMNAVDPGWITFQHPHPIVTQMQARGTEPPFSISDAAARICDPIWTGLNTGNNQFGRLFKDYRVIDW